MGSHALNGYMALERGVFRSVDLAHAASSEAAGNREAADCSARKSIGNLRIGCRWGRVDGIFHALSAVCTVPAEFLILIFVAGESQSECRDGTLGGKMEHVSRSHVRNLYRGGHRGAQGNSVANCSRLPPFLCARYSSDLCLRLWNVYRIFPRDAIRPRLMPLWPR